MNTDYFTKQDIELAKLFEFNSVIVYGKKGTGKDVIFQHVINIRNAPHYSNIKYSKLSIPVRLKDISAGKNTFKNLINGTIKPFKRPFKIGYDIYISDAGIYLPSQYQGKLCETYPGMPMYYALSRHLGRHNIHCNTQNLIRVWDKLREQANCYINTIKTISIDDNLITKIIVYSDYKSALAEMPSNPFNKIEQSEKYTFYRRRYGLIKEMLIKVPLSTITYNTYAFEDKFIIKEHEPKIQQIEIKRRDIAIM